jgi:DNA polymerase III epsilon subunit-like protein
VYSVVTVVNSWVEHTIHFVDFEGSLSSGILEYGVVSLGAGKVQSTQTRLCQSIGRIRPEDRAIHGLGEDALNDCEPFSKEFEGFAGLRESGPLAAHFAGAENSLLKSVWPYPRKSPDFARPDQQSTDWGPWIDTGALYRQFYPQMTSLKLADVVTACGLQSELDELTAQYCPVERRHYHAALYDALAGAVLLLSLAREPKVAELSVMQLLALSTLDGERRAAIEQDKLF